jgi:hypothetical protein
VTTPLNPEQQTASQIIQAQLDAWGIGSLAADLNKLIRQGLGQDAILLQLQQSQAYKDRFAGNIARQRNGLAVLSPGDYVALETQYRGVLRQFGLPAGFYDANPDLQKFIENDVSPAELQTRAQAAQQVWLSADTSTKQAWTSYYGLTAGDAIATLLNPDVALPIVQRRATAAQIGGAAIDNGLAAPTATRAEYLADKGVGQADAAKGYGQIGQAVATDQAIATRFGTDFGQTDEEDARLVGLASAQRKLRDLQNSEQGLFSGRAGATSQSLTTATAGRY